MERTSNTEGKDKNTYKLAVIDSIHNALTEIGFEYDDMSVDEVADRGYKPDMVITPFNRFPILEWWFVIKQLTGEHISEDHLVDEKWLIGDFMFLRENHARKISVVVDDSLTFESILAYRDHLSYRGNLSVILIDRSTGKPTKEVYLSHFDCVPADEVPETDFTLV